MTCAARAVSKIDLSSVWPFWFYLVSYNSGSRYNKRTLELKMVAEVAQVLLKMHS